MKNVPTAKSIRWPAAAVTALLLLVLLVPQAGAVYTEKVANINNSISKITAPEADSLFIALMNKAYPVNCVYMTTEFATAGAMEAHFGGEWAPCGVGQIPVGVDPAVAAFDVLKSVTAVNSGGGAVPVSMNGLAATGSVTMTPTTGSTTAAAGGTASWVGAGSVTLGAAGSYTYDFAPEGDQPNGATDVKLTAGTMPPHKHPTSLTVTSQAFNHGSDGSTAWHADLLSGTPVFYDSRSGGSGTLAWRITMTAWGINPATSVTALDLSLLGTLNLADTTKYGANISKLPTISYTPPTAGYAAQGATNNITVNASGSVTKPDDTIMQPTVTCYIYIRTALAPLNS